MTKKKEEYPECVTKLAERFRLEAADVASAVANPQGSADLMSRDGERVHFIFGDAGLFKVAKGLERESYIMEGDGVFGSIYTGSHFPIGGMSFNGKF